MTDSIKPALFISTDFNEQAGFTKDIDRMEIRDYLRQIPVWTGSHEWRIVVRDAPAVSGLLRYLGQQLGQAASDIVVVPENAPVSDIVAQHHPEIALFLGGFASTAADFAGLQKQDNVKLVPLPATGGASHDLYAKFRDALDLAPEAHGAMKQGSWAIGAVLDSCAAKIKPNR
jgi:hypothetical protein